jgi:hypothetical protein
MQRALLADGPAPGASVIDVYYESLKKTESEKAQVHVHIHQAL